MRIPMFVIAVASLVALSGLAKADDHLFQAVVSGGLIGDPADSESCCSTRSGKPIPDSAGRGSPFTSFGNSIDEQGIPSTDQDHAHHGQALPDQAGPKP
jgi:hypothetical protein